MTGPEINQIITTVSINLPALIIGLIAAWKAHKANKSSNNNNTNILLSTTTHFIVDRYNGIDIVVASTSEAIDSFIASSTISIASCTSWTSFSLVDCMSLMFYPSPDIISKAVTKLRTDLFSYAPMGYITRTYDLFATTSTSTLPDISFTFASDFPITAFAGTNFHFAIWDNFFSSGSVLNDTLKSTGDDPKNVWDILQPLFTLLVYLTLIYMVVNDLLKIHTVHSNKDV